MTRASSENPGIFPIFDGHNDVLLTLHRPHHRDPDGRPRSFFERAEEGHLDLPRAREGGFGGGMFAICVGSPDADPANERIAWNEDRTAFSVEMEPPLDQAYALAETVAVMARLFRLEAESGGQVRVTRTVDEIEACSREGALAVVLHLEGAEAIDPACDALEVFYRAGVRSLGPVWSRPNAFGWGAPFRFPSSPDTGPGLTDAGRTLVRACNRLGILIDLAHMNEQGFWDVAAITDAPLVSTHSGAHALCAAARNLTDRQLDAIGDSGGVVGVIFFTGNLRQDGKWERDTPLAEIVRHITYIADRIGIEHVALGSDFDGATLPDELKDVTGLPKLVDALRQAGFDEPALRQIARENWLRVLRQTWK